MNTKISMPELAALLALRTSLSSAECEAFLRQYVASITAALEAGEPVKIKDFGTFKLTSVEPRRSISVVNGDEVEIPSHNRITFIPSKELAAEINAPFEAFEAVEIPDEDDSFVGEVPDEDGVFDAEEESEPEEVPVVGAPAETLEEEEPPVVISSAQKAVEDSDYIFDSADEADAPAEKTAFESAETADSYGEKSVYTDESDYRLSPAGSAPLRDAVSPEPRDVESVQQRKRRYSSRSFLKGFLLGILTTIVILICAIVLLAVFRKNIVHLPEGYDIEAFIVADNDALVKGKTSIATPVPTAATESTPATGEEEKVAVADDKEKVEVPTAASDTKKEPEPVYDTISTTRYLTTMAKEHYGNYHLWPYIYEENKAILGHPDRIRPGTKVRIPSLDKYGVNPKDPAAIAKAKKMGVAIYARYK